MGFLDGFVPVMKKLNALISRLCFLEILFAEIRNVYEDL